MATKTVMKFEGETYYSMATAAKLLGTTTTKLREIIGAEKFEYRNFKENGPLWVKAVDIQNYLKNRISP